MAKLTANQESFVERMKVSDELARHGFELLLARNDFEIFLDALITAGLFQPEKNPKIVPGDEPNTYRVPYWHALDYLEAIAKFADEKRDIALAKKVMEIIRNISTARDPDNTIRDNHHTFRKFADILGCLPTSGVSVADLELIPVWLSSKFDRGWVAHALDKGALQRFLSSEDPEDWDKACAILLHCTAITWGKDVGFLKDKETPVSVVEAYWLKQLIKNHAATFGVKVGKKAADILLERVREVFSRDNREHDTWIWRPAIEDHEQNSESREAINHFVEGFRDVVLNWFDSSQGAATPYVEGLLKHPDEIVRRIGIHVLDRRWSSLKDFYLKIVGPDLFQSGHLHELYGLLRNHFADFSQEQKEVTLEAIRNLPVPTSGEEPEEKLKRIQRNWLSAVTAKGYEPADKWFDELLADASLGGFSRQHPDFYSYMTVGWGSGPAAYEAPELIAFAGEGSLVEKLNAFEQKSEWRGPSTESLVKALEQAVAQKPELFVQLLPAFLNAKRPFQYGLIKAFKDLWGKSEGEKKELDWEKAWSELITFFEELLTPAFWAEATIDGPGLTPTKDWIPPLIADFIQDGTKKDEHVYPAELLARTWPIIQRLLEKLTGVQEPAKEDAMFQAINSARGRVIEALFTHALRSFRLADKSGGGHGNAWGMVEPVFKAELERCKDANYEFSTLCGNYIQNLLYMEKDWLSSNISKIFPEQYPSNCACAIEGLAYANASRPLYLLLTQTGTMDVLLRSDHKGRYGREKLMQRIALAYLWGDEELDSPRFAFLWASGSPDDFTDLNTFLWSVGKQDLSAEQVQRVLKYWERCLKWCEKSEPPSSVLSSLSRLATYLDVVSARELPWLLGVAPYVHFDHNEEHFIEELERMAEASPAEVSAVLEKVLEAHLPSWDFQDKLQSLLTKLAANGRKQDAIKFAEKLRNHIPGMLQLYTRLTTVPHP